MNGTAVFRASAAVLRIDAEDIRLAAPADRFFAKLPTPGAQSNRRLHQVGFRVPQLANGGMHRVYGRWPGDETDDDILRTLSEIE